MCCHLLVDLIWAENGIFYTQLALLMFHVAPSIKKKEDISSEGPASGCLMRRSVCRLKGPNTYSSPNAPLPGSALALHYLKVLALDFSHCCPSCCPECTSTVSKVVFLEVPGNVSQVENKQEGLGLIDIPAFPTRIPSLFPSCLFFMITNHGLFMSGNASRQTLRYSW